MQTEPNKNERAEAVEAGKSKKADTAGAEARRIAIEPAAKALSRLAAPGAINAEAERLGLVPSENPVETAEAIIRKEGVAVQGHFAALVINVTHGAGIRIDPDDLTQALAEAFPKAGVGKRHGPHYLCHARKGRLKGLREGLGVIPFAKKAKKAADEPTDEQNKADAAADSVDAEVNADAADAVTVESLMAGNDRKTLQDMAKAMGLSPKGKTEEIAQRIADQTNAK